MVTAQQLVKHYTLKPTPKVVGIRKLIKVPKAFYQMRYHKGFQQTEFLVLPFIFYWKPAIFLPFTE